MDIFLFLNQKLWNSARKASIQQLKKKPKTKF